MSPRSSRLMWPLLFGLAVNERAEPAPRHPIGLRLVLRLWGVAIHVLVVLVLVLLSCCAIRSHGAAEATDAIRSPRPAVHLDAWTSACDSSWARLYWSGFYCDPSASDGQISFNRVNDTRWEMARAAQQFTVEVITSKRNRYKLAENHLSVCTGWLVSRQLVLVNAHCVAPDTESDQPVRIQVRHQHPVKHHWRTWPASRVCWPHAIWDYERPVGAYEMALVKLERELPAPEAGASPRSVCLKSPKRQAGSATRQEEDEWVPDTISGRAGTQYSCALVSTCRNLTALAPKRELYFQLTGVEPLSGPARLPCSSYTKEPSWLLTCFQSIHGHRHDIRGASCPLELGRAVFCYDKCPTDEENSVPYLAAVGPRTLNPSLDYRPLEINNRFSIRNNASVGTFVNILKLENSDMFAKLLIDTQLHTHGGSQHSVCRNLGPNVEELSPLHIHSMGHQRAPGANAGVNANNDFVPSETAVDAYDRLKCWSAQQSNLTGDFALPLETFRCQPETPEEVARRLGPQANAAHTEPNGKLPFLVELFVGKKEVHDDPARPPKNHFHRCPAWLINHNIVLAHAACVAPENPLDSVRGAEVTFRSGQGLLMEPKPRLADKACWRRSSASHGRYRPLELAVVRWPNSVSYTPGRLQPACLFPTMSSAQKLERPACTLVASCQSPSESKPEEGKVSPTGPTVALPVTRNYCENSMQVAEQEQPPSSGHGSLPEVTCYAYDYSQKLEPLCPPGTYEIARTALCWDQCPPHHGTSYLSTLELGMARVSRTPGVMYEADRARLDLDNPYGSLWAGLSLETTGRQIRELLLALNGDHEGTREVSCQMMNATTW